MPEHENIPADFDADLAWTNDDMKDRLKCSLRMIEYMAVDGRIGPRPIKIGAMVRWNAAEIRRWFEAGCPHRDIWQTIKGCDQCVAGGEVCKACRQFAAHEAARTEIEDKFHE